MAVRLFSLLIHGYIYLLFPYIIFLLGWVRPLISIPLAAALIFALYGVLKSRKFYREELFFTKKMILLTLIFSLCWPILAGIAGIFPMRYDSLRFTMFKDLIDFSWPTIYPKNGHAVAYYTAHWLPPALVGKLLGWTVAQIALILWTAYGMFIGFMLFLFILKTESRLQIFIAFFMFIFFSSLISLNIKISYPVYLEYAARYGSLSWVYNQNYGMTIMAVLFLLQKNFRFMALFILPVALYSPYALLGIAPFIIIRFFTEYTKKIWKDVFSIENIIASLAILPILFFYLTSNATSSQGFSFILLKHDLWGLIYIYLVNFGIYMILIFNDHKKNYLFYTCLFVFIAVSAFQYSTDSNFGRTNNVALFFLLVMVTQSLLRFRDTFSYYLFAGIMIIGTYDSSDFIADQITKITKGYHDISLKTYNKDFNELKSDNMSIYLSQWATPSPENTVFFKYLAKKKPLSRQP